MHDWVCPVCDFETDDAVEFWEHVENEHTVTITDEPMYTRSEVDNAVLFASNLAFELSGSDRDEDFLNVYNAAFDFKLTGAKIAIDDGKDRPVKSLDDVLNVNWGDSEFDREKYPDAAAWVRSWWSDWA